MIFVSLVAKNYLQTVLCVRSKSGQFLFDISPDHSGAQNSRCERMNSLYMSSRVSSEAPSVFSLLKNHILPLACATKLVVFTFHLQSEVQTTPKSLVLYTISSLLSFRVRLGSKSFFLEKLKGIIFVFLVFNFIS